ncbi:hypothetical protein D9758_009955 [Tetrapyrgos nigripes]|uniref:C2H2-type domain-containing protein n=1 Tax=Tetrapyrgos nigripes TaxID=182062 RepID=A0A8H5CR62_9AGAR|nr:hypothetical protein D9758_009955 [Tetrapyrgos nigripes]
MVVVLFRNRTDSEYYQAGHGTTTHSTIAWFIFLAVHFAEIQVKAQQELDKVIGRSRLPSFVDFKHLLYILAIVKETLRWRPVALLGVVHSSIEDDVYEGYFIPRGTLCMPNIWFMNRDPKVYGLNVNTFRPEHHLDPSTGDIKDLSDEGSRHVSYGFGYHTNMIHLSITSAMTASSTLIPGWVSKIIGSKVQTTPTANIATFTSNICTCLRNTMRTTMTIVGSVVRYSRTMKGCTSIAGSLQTTTTAKVAHFNSSIHRERTISCPFRGCNQSFIECSHLVLHLKSGRCTSGIDHNTVNCYVHQYDRNNIITDPAHLLTGPDSFPNTTVRYSATNASWNGRAYECYLCHRDFTTLAGLNQHLNSSFHDQEVYLLVRRFGYTIKYLGSQSFLFSLSALRF